MGQSQTGTKPPARPGQAQGQVQEQKPQTAEQKKIAKKLRSIKLAEKRTSAVLEKIRLLGNLASPNYALTAEQKKEIVDILENGVAELGGRFEQAYTAEKTSWHFSS